MIIYIIFQKFKREFSFKSVDLDAFFLVQRKWNRVRCLRIRAVRVLCAGAERFPRLLLYPL